MKRKEPGEEYFTIEQVEDNYPVNRIQLLYLILTGEIRVKKIKGAIYVERDSLFCFFEERWEHRKDNIRDEIQRIRRKRQDLINKGHRDPLEELTDYDNFLKTVEHLASFIIPDEILKEDETPGTTSEGKQQSLNKKVKEISHSLSEKFHSLVHRLFEKDDSDEDKS